MGTHKNLQSYKDEWVDIAELLAAGKSAVLQFKTKAEAQALRLRFYNFRSILQNHDPDNPWIKPLMETVATIEEVKPPELPPMTMTEVLENKGWERPPQPPLEFPWTLTLGEDRFREILRRALGRRVEAPIIDSPPEPTGPSTEDVLESMYGPGSGKPPEPG